MAEEPVVGGFKHTPKPDTGPLGSTKVEGRRRLQERACGHLEHVQAEVAYGARSEAREAEFELLWEMLREELCSRCQRGEEVEEPCAGAPPRSERPSAHPVQWEGPSLSAIDEKAGRRIPPAGGPSLFAITKEQWAKQARPQG